MTSSDQEIADATIRALERPPLREEIAGAEGVGAKGKLLLEWLKSTRPGRTLARVGVAKGNLLAGGIAYAALISLFAALAIGWTIFMAVLGDNEQLRGELIATVNRSLPGILDDGSGNGLLRPDDLVQDTALNLTSMIALLVLVWSALVMMAALKASIRRMFGVVSLPENFVFKKLRDLMGFGVLALATLVTSVASLAANSLGNIVFDWLAIDGPVTAFLLRAGTFLLGAAVDFAVFIFLFRFFAGLRIPRRDLLMGAALGGFATAVLRVLGTTLIGATDNPLLASAAALVTILVWVNLVSRVALIVAAFTANPPAPVIPESAEEVHFDQTPNYVTLSAPETLALDHHAATGAVSPRRPEPEPEPPRPKRGGLIGWMKRRKIERLERRLASARDRYYE
jgi:membrane protein